MKIVLGFVAFLLAGTSAFAESGTVLNGGDAVFCKASQGSEFKGLYSLDYLVTYDKSASPIYQPKNLKESLARISYLIKKKLPELSPSFKVFAKNIGNKDPHFTYIWEEANFGLVDVKDEDLVNLLPENCRGQHGKVQLIQAVVRKPAKFTGMPGKIVFGYQPKLIKEMNESAPLQLSFLLVHEWLWELSQDVQRNRRINRFLHSKALEELSRERIVSTLREMGFAPPGDMDALLYKESCLPNPKGIANLFPNRPNERETLAAPILLGESKNCGEMYNNTCVSYGIKRTTEFFKDYFVVNPNQFGVALHYGGIIKLIQNPGDGLFTHLTCTVDFNTGYLTCDNLLDRYGNPLLQNGGRFSGTMSRSCIRISASQVKDRHAIRDGDWWREESYVIFSRLQNR